MVFFFFFFTKIKIKIYFLDLKHSCFKINLNPTLESVSYMENVKCIITTNNDKIDIIKIHTMNMNLIGYRFMKNTKALFQKNCLLDFERRFSQCSTLYAIWPPQTDLLVYVYAFYASFLVCRWLSVREIGGRDFVLFSVNLLIFTLTSSFPTKW